MGIYRLNPERNLSVPDPRFHTPDVVRFCQKMLADVGLDCASFSWHSSRSGGVSSVANGECLRDTGDGVRKTLKMVMLQTR